MPVRIAHISDTHLGTRPSQGVKQNVWGVEMRTRLLENDYYERFSELFDKIAASDPPVDLVIHSGDLYNSPWEMNPTQPPPVAQEIAISVLKNFIEATGIPILIIEGNHGLYRTLEVSLLDTLKLAVPGLDIATQQDLKKVFSKGEPLVTKYDKMDVYCFPFMERNVLESADKLQDFTDWITSHQRPDSKRPSIAVAHGMDLDKTLYSEIFSMSYDYIALGHDHHQHKHAKNAWYAGSPERWRFDEIRHDKGFLMIDISEDHNIEIIPQILEYTRPVFNETITIDNDDSVDSVMDKLDSLLQDIGVKQDWEPTTAARIRIVFEGSSSHVNSLDLSVAMESKRLDLLDRDSTHNISQFVWSVKVPKTEHDPAAYPEIESDYLIENPKDDFLEYLGTVTLDEQYDSSMLARIAVRALKKSVAGDEGKLNLEDITEDDST
ncbi:MAG: metallophosphoesterase [Candidatus Thorarchaeota archaeon]|nr:metallophosphoesterase [Candidatus Thorarchaeota archaeon]